MLISTGCAEMLEASFSGVPKEILIRVKQRKKQKVSEELRSFAMTLHFYSAKAYAFVRECFDLVLPHPETIRSWYSKISADPGFTQPAFSAIKSRVEERKREGKETLCALMMDEVSIRKHLEYAAGKFHGYVDLGCGIVDDSLPPAKDALVLMVVAIDDSWKIPVAYFLIDGLTGEERANIIKECLLRLHAIGARVFSSSVADALEFCNTQLHLPQFRGCEETVEFLRTIDAAFDALNSRNPLGKGYKAPMRTSNKERAEQILLKAQKSLLELKEEKGIPVHAGKRKTCVVGFIASCISVWNVFQEAVCKPNAQCRYLLTYKLSQDHLELFFSAVRARGGFNNNPTARQFTAAYKRLLVKLQVRTGTGNCILRDNTSILGATPAAANTLRRYDLKPVEHAESEHDYHLCPNVDAVSEYKEAAINYIAGFVVKKIKQKHNCMPCAEALTSETTVHPFVLLKTRGGLQKPSPGIIAVCMESERCFQRILRTTSGKLPQGHGLTSAITNQVLMYSADKVLFPELHFHTFETTVEDNHVHVLVKMASFIYCKVRMHHLARRETEKMTKDIVRHQFTKLIHFHHQ
ncbi:hypothetical protein JOQ06_019724 [Pogonophryne albipinna]|uniref:DNA transposase THAP9 n=1 Tax=Pogonophryne albipinna TaxID=1090488 RepID=A0AAD6BQW2_9TELE|nr:hypothetical protein JOQ06_019724 [Pogonophryne albipinna]